VRAGQASNHRQEVSAWSTASVVLLGFEQGRSHPSNGREQVSVGGWREERVRIAAGALILQETVRAPLLAFALPSRRRASVRCSAQTRQELWLPTQVQTRRNSRRPHGWSIPERLRPVVKRTFRQREGMSSFVRASRNNRECCSTHER